ncbi:uncharacterized protein BDW47DRAFT_21638 [Aspergillus candidus]|uniref:Uncharacterized protein n=1 Tax=Aspergillus candidus TaxID=41067 RepID=A0A2I2FDE9_ASPCN|nr:hypothetical protein BDW47DRAFT_21638 [Aspergillus candidus]PLB38617.1 hypothetical protein BDW47DRAFT_21638 [Aspergillus candidus]
MALSSIICIMRDTHKNVRSAFVRSRSTKDRCTASEMPLRAEMSCIRRLTTRSTSFVVAEISCSSSSRVDGNELTKALSGRPVARILNDAWAEMESKPASVVNNKTLLESWHSSRASMTHTTGPHLESASEAVKILQRELKSSASLTPLF